MVHIERVKDPMHKAEGQPSDISIRRNSASEKKRHWASTTGPIGIYITTRTKRMLDAYRADPDLVAEHANQEDDTARGGYARRQLFELVQNSADALTGSTGGRIWIGLTREYLYCADEGQPIDQDGVRALMHAYLSPKRGSDEIGRFGLGFKSVLGVSDRPEFFSRSGSFRFDPKNARELVQKIDPDAGHFPALRLPEPIDPHTEFEEDSILSGLSEWASNVVRLQLTVGAHENLQRQMDEFPAEFLLFVEHVSNLTLQNDSNGTFRSYSITKDVDLYLLNDGKKTSKWMVTAALHELSDKAREDRRNSDDSGNVQITWAAPIDNLGEPGKFWAYFPTETSSLLAGILNAPWKTNEDRQNLLDGTYNSELIRAAASMVAGALSKLSTTEDPGRHWDALPRRLEAGDQGHSILLRHSLYAELEQKEIVPNQDGILQKMLEISYPPEEMPDNALRRWSNYGGRPRNWLHHSVLTTNGPGRQARLGLTARSRRQFDWNWPVLVRASIPEWLEALTSGADTDLEKIQASMSAIQTASEIEVSVRERSALGKIVLTSSERWADADPESVFLGGGSQSASVASVHSELQRDPHTLAALIKLGIRPASPETLLKQAVSVWSTGQNDFLNEGYGSQLEYETWLPTQWEAFSTFKQDVLESLGERLSTLKGVSGFHVLHAILIEQRDTPPDYNEWMSRYWELFWQSTREVTPQEAAGIIQDSQIDWRETLHVRTINGTWNPFLETLLPGPVVPHDGSRDSNVCVDILYHEDDVPLIEQMGSTSSPREGQELSRSRLRRFTAECRRAYTQQEGLPSNPREDYLIFKSTATSGPLDPLEVLSDEGKAQLTWYLLELPDTYLPWIMRHSTRGFLYPEMSCQSPALVALREHGRIRTDEGIYSLSEGLGESPQNLSVRTALLSHPQASLIRRAFALSAPADAIDDDDDDWTTIECIRVAREQVRACATDELRLLKAVGEQGLLSRLPAGLIEVLEIENSGTLTAPQVAQAALATFHTGALYEHRGFLGHLDPPRQWAGSSRAIAFVKSMGFGEEWAMERGVRREPFLEIDGPQSLPELHGYQRKIVDKVRTLIQRSGSAADRRGMISMATGSGKTRVAVQSIVEAMREDAYNGGVLWVADRDELCEQAVESWRQVWASEGTQGTQLRISRMWGGQPAPLPTSNMHVIVATIQTLSLRVASQPERYDFLLDFELIVFDEAHRSVTASSTAVMQELGLTRWRKEDEPLLVGLTATPYRGRDERETQRLVNRYGRRRLDEGAFSSDDPEKVIKELQGMQVIAKADHATIQGGNFELDSSELSLSKNVPWLPQSVEQRIAGDVDRTRRIVKAYNRLVPPDWPTLIFATSVEHSKTVAALLTSGGVSARAVSADTDSAVRRRVVEQFRAGDIRVLVNYGIFNEGFDAPKTRAIVVARPVYSPNLYFQMIGRGLRGVKNGGNDRCLILNVSDNIDNFQRNLAFSELDWLWDEASPDHI